MEARGGAKMSGAAHVDRVSHGSGGGHRAPAAPLKAQLAPRYWDADDPLEKGRKMPSNVPTVHPIYARMDFAPYEFAEYPMMVYPNSEDPLKPTYVNGVPQEGVTVNDEDELAEALAGRKIVRETDEKERLIALAEVDGVTVDKRWSVKRMAETIEAAGFDPTANPFD